MSRHARVCIPSLTIVLVVFFGIAASANEQIAWRYNQNLKTDSLLRRIACTESQTAACKQSITECYEQCAKNPDIGARAFCMNLCSNEATRCYQACNR